MSEIFWGENFFWDKGLEGLEGLEEVEGLEGLEVLENTIEHY